jgi:NMD protein affecting ribosome stability and mRNA decay
MSETTSDLKCEMCGKELEAGEIFYLFIKRMCWKCYVEYGSYWNIRGGCNTRWGWDC